MSSSPFAPTGVQSLSDCELHRVLARVPDPRDRRGVRYPLPAVLAVAISAVLAGSRSFAAISEWGADLELVRLQRFGLDKSPEEPTIRKLFARLDGAALDRLIGVFMWTRTCQAGGKRIIAIDGKTVRGARSGTDTAPHLVAALDHTVGSVLGQVQVEAKSNEIPAVRDLLKGFDPTDLAGAVITVDAMHTQTDTAQLITEAGANYVFTVKGNQPTLLAQLKALPWRQLAATSSTERGHGRCVTRAIKVADVPDWASFTGAAQIAQLRRTVTKKGKKSVEVVYLITSADGHVAPPHVLATWVQGHWAIENSLHWVRDVTFDEDRSPVRTGNAPHIMATIRNTAITLLRLDGWTCIAKATRHHQRNPDRPITCLLTS